MSFIEIRSQNYIGDMMRPDGKMKMLGIVLLASVIIFLVFNFSFSPECGDSKRDKSENCWSCPKDCKCVGEEYCSEEEHACVLSDCGNGIWEPYETWQNCCEDTGCIGLELCDSETHSCRLPDIGITDEDAIRFAEDFAADELNQPEIEIYRVLDAEYGGEVVKFVDYMIPEEGGIFRIAVFETGSTEEVLIY